MTPLTIHIGMNKTGTSALQSTLFRNRGPLERAGLIYPKAGLGTRAAGAGMHFQLSETFRSGDAMAPRLLAGLLDEIDRSQAAAALVSSEFFVELRKLDQLAEGLNGREVSVLVYLRRHDHWITSLFSQAIKSQASPPWAPNVEAFIAHARKHLAHYYVYSRLLDRWADAFGRDAIKVRVYGSGGARDIVRDVLGGFGLSPDDISGFRGGQTRVNGSPSRRQLAAIDHIQRAPYPKPVKTTLVQRILASDDADRPRQLMTSATALALIDEHGDDYHDIANRYLGRRDGVLFDEALPEPGGPERIALWPGEGITVLSELLRETV